MPTGSTGFTSKYGHTLPCMMRRAIQGQQQLMVKRKAGNMQQQGCLAIREQTW